MLMHIYNPSTPMARWEGEVELARNSQFSWPVRESSTVRERTGETLPQNKVERVNLFSGLLQVECGVCAPNPHTHF